MKTKTPVITTLVIVAITAALMLLRQQPPTTVRVPVSVAQAGITIPDTEAAKSPNLPAPVGQQTPPTGDFVYLFDVSGSTKNSSASAHSAFDQGVALLQPMFQALRQLDELMPQRHRVATIGAMSLRGYPRCDIHVSSRTLFTATDSMAPLRAMRACTDTLRAAPPEPYTDISGALSFAGLSLTGDWKAVRGILLVTDLEEDRAPGTKPAHANLRGMCIAVYTLITSDVERNPQLLDRREHEWQSKLTAWGAYRVHMQSSLGFDAADLQNFFRGCEGH